MLRSNNLLTFHSDTISFQVGNCFLHPIVTAVCASHLTLSHVFSAFLTSSHLISYLLSFPQLFSTRLNSSHIFSAHLSSSQLSLRSSQLFSRRNPATKRISAPKPHKYDFEAFFKTSLKDERNMERGKRQSKKYHPKLVVATLAQPFQCDLQAASCRRQRTTCATATQSNHHAATPMQFASTRLQKPIELSSQDTSFSWPKPAPKPDLGAKAKKKYTILNLYSK